MGTYAASDSIGTRLPLLRGKSQKWPTRGRPVRTGPPPVPRASARPDRPSLARSIVICAAGHLTAGAVRCGAGASLPGETKRLPPMRAVVASPARRCPLRTQLGEGASDPLSCKEFGDRHQVLAGRDQHRNVALIDLGQTDRVGGHWGIDALILFWRAHVGIATGAFGCPGTAAGAARWRPIGLPRNH